MHKVLIKVLAFCVILDISVPKTTGISTLYFSAYNCYLL